MRLDDRLRALRRVVMEPPTTGSMATDADQLALRTYRYARVLIVVLTVGLLAAIVVEQVTAGCLLSAISAYYYTPARGMFTGGLIGIGVCLIAIRGENDLQDGLLKFAGLFGPMVALVPMHLNVGTAEHPSHDALCIINAHRVTDLRPGNISEATFSLVTAGRLDSIRNNTWSLLIMIGVGLIVLGCVIWWERRHPRSDRPKPKLWPWAVSVLVGAGVWALYLFAYGFYIEKVHFATAILMLAAISVYAVVDGIRTIGLQGATKRGVTYIVLGIILLGGGGAIIAVGKAAGWGYSTFTAEVWGIGVFLVFWIVQTIDLWNHTSRRTAILSIAAE